MHICYPHTSHPITSADQYFYNLPNVELPHQLPMHKWDPAQLKQRIGLLGKKAKKEIPPSTPILEEWQAFELWNTTMHDFTRQTAPVKHSTFKGIKDTASRFLGFARQVRQYPWDAISLRLFMNAVSRSA
ncbi:hypothetical protein TSOC_013674 [Tetrabaena socialis]|uniref:Uncharacterized protein n=1 Tax=Tetrabaena socialis TaxID=47790 RepID=A0A2J7ZJQ3_9CHLO|nr:hypothetical protein TSOC_013674 [Tetrabaena socialis]|eukprot:PNH00498.1 hypothetical protein TSOC_013674 [Tetrabaena socialis]